MAVSPMVTLRAADGLDAELAARGDSLNAVALRDLRRYYDALRLTEREVGLSEQELDYLRDILNGSLLDVDGARHLWAEVEDAEPATAERWGVDTQVLAGHIRAMPLFARLAIVDAVERWWREQ